MSEAEPTPQEVRDAQVAKRDAKDRYSPDAYRAMPQNKESEKGALCSILISPRECMDTFVAMGGRAEWFYIPGHEIMCRALLDMHDQGDAIDFITLTGFLRDTGQLDKCGGAAYVTEVSGYIGFASNAVWYFESLQKKYTNRILIKVCTEFAARGYDEQDNEELLDQAEQAVFAIRDTPRIDTCSPAKPLVVKAIGQIEEMYERRGSITGLATGFPDFDKLTNGLEDGSYNIIAARPSMGKSSYSMNIAEFVAIDLKKTVHVFSLEMSKEQLMQRMLCSCARVDLTRVREGFLSERDFPALQAAASKLAESKIFIDDATDLSIQELRARARRMAAKEGTRLVVIDYVQLLKSNTERARANRNQEVTEISAGCKALAKELKCPVIVLAQIGRKVEERGGRPRLSDLKESGSLEQDADLVAFIHRPERYADTQEEREELKGQAELYVEKNRVGPCGDIPLTFLAAYCRFETRASDHDEPAALPERELPL